MKEAKNVLEDSFTRANFGSVGDQGDQKKVSPPWGDCPSTVDRGVTVSSSRNSQGIRVVSVLSLYIFVSSKLLSFNVQVASPASGGSLIF